MTAQVTTKNKIVLKTAIKRENGIDYPPRDFAYVPDPASPSTWKLRLTEGPGKVSVSQLGRAAAALSPGGFRGNRVDIPQGALSSVKRRILAEYRRLGVSEDKIPNSVKEIVHEKAQNGMVVWKEAGSDRWRWLAVYSNHFRDSDYPAEILSQKSHETFVELVDKGLVDYPELWLWHVPGTAWGKADMIAYTDGFAVAAGYVYPGFEQVAKTLAKETDVRVSHGMPKNLVVYKETDPTVIDFYVTMEISPLPGWAAANKLTGFVVMDQGEKEMPLPAEKKEWLNKMGLPQEVIDSLESNLKAVGDAARDAGIESKEQTEASVENAAEQIVEEEPVAQATDEKAAKMDDMDDEEDEAKKPRRAMKEAETPAYATREEVAAAITEIINPMMQTIREMSDQMQALSKELSKLKQSDAEKIAATKEVTPTLSLREIIANNLIGKEAARVDGRTALGKEGPKETVAPQAPITLSPFIDTLINRAQG